MDKHEELKQKCEALAVLIATGRVLPTQDRTNRQWVDMGHKTAARRSYVPRLLLNK
jgi:hypothetical protein